eukprot:3000477-Pyramimonas_sp.AAC.1
MRRFRWIDCPRRDDVASVTRTIYAGTLPVLTRTTFAILSLRPAGYIQYGQSRVTWASSKSSFLEHDRGTPACADNATTLTSTYCFDKSNKLEA